MPKCTTQLDSPQSHSLQSDRSKKLLKSPTISVLRCREASALCFAQNPISDEMSATKWVPTGTKARTGLQLGSVKLACLSCVPEKMCKTTTGRCKMGTTCRDMGHAQQRSHLLRTVYGAKLQKKGRGNQNRPINPGASAGSDSVAPLSPAPSVCCRGKKAQLFGDSEMMRRKD